MQIHKLLKHSRQHKFATGFTLVELLISSFIGVLIIGAAGYGMMNLLRNNRTATAQIQKRTEFNRATEFISDEMRRADTIDVDPTTAFAAVPSPPANAQPVLALNIPGVTNPAVAGVDSPIIYFVSSPSNGDSSVWNGPRVIYRYGPPLDTNGSFSDGANWAKEPLVDGITADSVTPNCDNGWTASPSSGATGFYACIQPTADDATLGETAKIFAIGKLDDGNYNSENYQASTQVFTRAEAENLDGVNPDETFNAACNFDTGALVCPGGGSRTYTVGDLASSMACTPEGDLWKIYVEAYYLNNSGTEVVLGNNNAGSFSFVTDQEPLFRLKPDKANSPAACSGANAFISSDQPGGIQNHEFVSSADTAQFKQLEDADVIDPSLENSYIDANGNPQLSAKDFFADPGNDLIDPYDNTKINLEDNRYVISFEIGQTNPNVNGGGFDTNDHILSITVTQ